MKKAINAAAAAIVALGPISLFVFTPLFMAPPANACEGGPAAVRMCELACSMGGQSAVCPASGAQPAGPAAASPSGARGPAAPTSGRTTATASSPTTGTAARSSRSGN
jgi:hypothetical protein